MDEENRKLWRTDLQQMTHINFYHRNIMEQYIYNMNNFDIADKLRGSYQIDKLIRKRKWWW